MHRFLALTVLCCGLGLVAATPRPLVPGPTPTPLPLPHLTMPSLAPTVLIYPFDTASDLNSSVGTRIATIFSHAFTQSGHVNVLPVPSGVARTSFLTYARAHKADYYISGYVTPIGNSASVVVQVVSVQDGIIAYAQTTQVTNYNDATSAALASHDAIMQLSGTNVDVTTSEAPSSAPSAAPTTNGANFNLGHLFTHHTTTARVATPTPPTRPDRGIILLAVHGTSSVPSADFVRATQLLQRDLATHFAVRSGGSAPANLTTAADAVCGADRDNTIATGTLAMQHVSGIRPRSKSVFTLQVWTCFGDMLYTTTESDFDTAQAITNAVSDYVLAHPSNG